MTPRPWPLTACLLIVAMAALPPAPALAQSWFNLGVGIGSGEVEYPCGGTTCREASSLRLLTSGFTVVDDLAMRLRYTGSGEFTENPPRELAGMLGVPLGGDADTGVIAFVGWGRIFNADDDFDGHADGVAMELLLARGGSGTVGTEFTLAGNLSGDVSYVAAMFSLRFGNLSGSD